MDDSVPALRILATVDQPPNAAGQYVIYWMTTARRVRWNFGLERAVSWAKSLKKPLVVVEVLTCGGRWDTDRSHRFAIQGMLANRLEFGNSPVLYYPFVESKPGTACELYRALATGAAVVVTDDFPIRLPVLASVDESVKVRLERVDSNGLMPLRMTERVFATAYSFRRFMQSVIRDHMVEAPRANPLARLNIPTLPQLPLSITKRWPALNCDANDPLAMHTSLPIDHSVAPAAIVGGSRAAGNAWGTFLRSKLARYPEERNQPEADATSGISPYLHWGHISAHEMFHDLLEHENWSPDRLSVKGIGQREGWWGMSAAAEAFMDQLITWRELGYNCCQNEPQFDAYESLPPWAKKTLADHAGDHRQWVYSLEEFRAAQTHDPLWNAAQRQLLREGIMHNYMRMLWGKKILQWSETPQAAFEVMVELNNRYALDGQNPNSYSGIFWTLGRYDRPWAPERPIFGQIRYMASENTARKLRVKNYVATYGS